MRFKNGLNTLKHGIEKDNKGWSSQVENNGENENDVIDDICPQDSVTNVASKHSSKQSHGHVSRAPSDGMNSYLERKTQYHTAFKSLNPMAKEYEPQQHTNQKESFGGINNITQ